MMITYSCLLPASAYLYSSGISQEDLVHCAMIPVNLISLTEYTIIGKIIKGSGALLVRFPVDNVGTVVGENPTPYKDAGTPSNTNVIWK